MAMKLTNEDLAAVKEIVVDAIDDSKLQTAAGFEEVHKKIDNIKETVDSIKILQQAELGRNDRQDKAITKIRKSLHAA